MDKDDELAPRKSAQVAMQYIIHLAQLEYSGKVTISGFKLDSYESYGLFKGETNIDTILDDRKLREEDFHTYLTRGDDDLLKAQEQQRRDETLPSVRQLPSAMFSQNMQDHVEHDIKNEGRRAEDREMEAWGRAYSLEKTFGAEITPDRQKELEELVIKQAAEREEKRVNFGYDRLPPAGKVVWVIEAKQHYDNGEFYIKTEDGKALPAWEDNKMTLNGKIISGGKTDNMKLSVDQKFYDKNGDPFYGGPAGLNVYERMTRTEEQMFSDGTPCFDDITEARLVDAVNSYTDNKAKQSPILALTLVAGASPLLKGLKVPNVADDDLKTSFWKKQYGDFLVDLLPEAVLEKKTEEDNLTDSLSSFVDEAKKISHLAQKNIDTKNNGPALT